MHVDDQTTSPAGVDAGLTVPEVAVAIDRKVRQVWNLLRGPEPAMESYQRETTDRLGRSHLQRFVAPEVVDAYLADRGSNTQGSGSGAGTGSGSGTSSGSGSTNTGGGAGTGPGRT